MRVGRLGSAANTASVSNEPNNVDSAAPAVTVAAVSCQALAPWRRHCTAPVTDTAPAFGAPTAETVTAPWVVTVEAGAVSDGAPYPNAYTPVAEAIPPGDFAYASTRCPPAVPPTVTVFASVLAVICVNDTLCHDPPSIRNHTLVGAEVAFAASKRAVIVHASAAATSGSQDPSPLTHAMVGVRGVANAVLTSTAGPHPDHDLPSYAVPRIHTVEFPGRSAVGVHDTVPPLAAEPRHTSTPPVVAEAEPNRSNTAVTVSASASLTGTDTTGRFTPTNPFTPADVAALVRPATDGATGTSGTRLYDTDNTGLYEPSEEWNLFQYVESVSESARSIIPTVDAVVADHAFACPVISSDTRAAGHDDEYPFATDNDARFTPIAGWDVQRVDVDATPESYAENERAVQFHDHDSNNDKLADTI